MHGLLGGVPVLAVVMVIVVLFLPRALKTIARSAGRAAGAATGTPTFQNAVTVKLGETTLDQAALAANPAIMAAVQQALGNSQAAGANALPPDGELGVAEVISISSMATGSPEVYLELDAIGAPKRRVSAQPLAGQDLERGDRVYVRLNPDDDQTVTILPPSMTGGQTLPRDGNRLDVLVLGPQILKSGDKAMGIVKSAEAVPLANAALAGRGFSKWRLQLDVRPERGWPYNAELTIALSTPEKAARIAHAGAEVPLRYDPEDPKTLSIDSIEMGYGDPYEAMQAATSGGAAGAGLAGALDFSALKRAGLNLDLSKIDLANASVQVSINGQPVGGAAGPHSVVLLDPGPKKLKSIKVLLGLRPDLGLKNLHDVVEGVRPGVGYTVKEGLSRSDAERYGRLLEAAGATVRID